MSKRCCEGLLNQTIGIVSVLRDGRWKQEYILLSFHGMLRSFYSAKRGFTLVEIMLVVAILSLLAALALPSWIRARKRTQASLVLSDLRLIEHAIFQWATDKNKTAGAPPCTLDELRPYLKPTQSPLYSSGKDIFNNSFEPFEVDVPPKVHPLTFAALSDVAPAEFWVPYH